MVACGEFDRPSMRVLGFATSLTRTPSGANPHVRIVDARRILSADRRGSSWPVLVDAGGGPWFTKLRGAGQGTGALVAEIVVGSVGRGARAERA